MPRFTIDLPEDINVRLTEIAAEYDISKAEAMRRAFALLSVAEKQKHIGKKRSLGVIEETEGGDFRVIGQIIGI